MNFGNDNSVSRSSLAILLALYLLMFWSDLPTFRPGMDSMTYGAVAKNILATGDWAVLHYTKQAYRDFFQHPPLAIWMMAGTMQLIEWIAGPAAARADWVLKLLPSLVAGIGAILVYVWARRIRGEWFAFLATLVLLTSTRYVKYSKGFMLDPFLATFSVAAVYGAVLVAETEKKRPLLAFFSGTMITSAFLSKGVFALAPLVLALFVLRKKRHLFLIGVFLPFFLWLGLGGGTHYLARYYVEHVAGRLGDHSFIEHLAPIRNLFKVYWPWLPLFGVGTWKIAKPIFQPTGSKPVGIRNVDVSILVPFLGAAFFIGGFCVAGSFLEQYHVATYPFAAIVVAYGLSPALEKFRPRIEKGLLVLLAVAALAIAIFPYSFRSTEYKNPVRVALKGAREATRAAGIEKSISRVTISTGVAEIWYALAMGAWNTEWDPRSADAGEFPGEGQSQVLLATAAEPVGHGWVETSVAADGLKVYRSSEIPAF